MQVRFEKGVIIYHATHAARVPTARGKFIVHKNLINSQIVDFCEGSFFLFANI